jgi:hypothetical protein
MSVPIQRLIAVVATAIAVALPLFHYLPLAYRWNVRRRLLFWYGRLQALEDSIEASADPGDLLEQQIELRRIEEALSSIRFPLAFSDQVYNLRSHVDIVRRRLRPRRPAAMAAE